MSTIDWALVLTVLITFALQVGKQEYVPVQHRHHSEV